MNLEELKDIMGIGIPSEELFHDVCDELLKYKQLEQDSGCLLECVIAAFKAMKQDHIYCDTGRGVYELHNFQLDYTDILNDEELYMGHFLRTDYHYVLDDDCTIFVEDYKKTWWLREDKSE